MCCWGALSVDLNQGNHTDCNPKPWLDSMSQHSDLMEGTRTFGLMMGLQYCKAGITLLRWKGRVEPSWVEITEIDFLLFPMSHN